jgi:hypothetical protein
MSFPQAYGVDMRVRAHRLKGTRISKEKAKEKVKKEETTKERKDKAKRI